MKPISKELLKVLNSREDYLKLFKSSMLWVYFPEFTGDYEEDKIIIENLKERNNDR